jgi:hypothetical protein
MSDKKNEPAPTEDATSTAGPGATETTEKQSLNKFFFLWFGIPFIIIVALGYLMSVSDSW